MKRWVIPVCSWYGSDSSNWQFNIVLVSFYVLDLDFPEFYLYIGHAFMICLDSIHQAFSSLQQYQSLPKPQQNIFMNGVSFTVLELQRKMSKSFKVSCFSGFFSLHDFFKICCVGITWSSELRMHKLLE